MFFIRSISQPACTSLIPLHSTLFVSLVMTVSTLKRLSTYSSMAGSFSAGMTGPWALW